MWKVDLINTIKSCAAGPAATIEQCTAQIDFAEKARGMKGKVVRMRGSFHHDRGKFSHQLVQYTSLNGFVNRTVSGPTLGTANCDRGACSGHG